MNRVRRALIGCSVARQVLLATSRQCAPTSNFTCPQKRKIKINRMRWVKWREKEKLELTIAMIRFCKNSPLLQIYCRRWNNTSRKNADNRVMHEGWGVRSFCSAVSFRTLKSGSDPIDSERNKRNSSNLQFGKGKRQLRNFQHQIAATEMFPGISYKTSGTAWKSLRNSHYSITEVAWRAEEKSLALFLDWAPESRQIELLSLMLCVWIIRFITTCI